MSKISKSFKAYGMHCKSCELVIEHDLGELDGIFSVASDYKTETVVVNYDDELCNEDIIKEGIKKAGYSTSNNPMQKLLGLSIIILAMLFLSNSSMFSFDTSKMLENASFFMLFVVGVLTSFHCVGMCGGIMLTQTLDKDNLLSNKNDSFVISFKYNLGRVMSYTLLGGVIGTIGSVFSLSPKAQGLIQIIAAIFMVLCGLKMLGVSILKNISFTLPFIKNKCGKNNNSPFVVGLLNGFMPCGALQTMQLYALSTGSFALGALSMFIFSLGTVPLMLGFGYMSSKLSKSFNNTIFKLSGIFIILLGVTMASRGLALSGSNFINTPSSKVASENMAPVVDGFQEVSITVDSSGYTPSTSYISGDLPVRLTINVEEVTGCNVPIYFPTFDKYLELSEGQTVVEIDSEGSDIPFTCWMGMIRGSINVVK